MRPTDLSWCMANGKLTGEVLQRRFANRAKGIRKESSVEWQRGMGERGKGGRVGGSSLSLDGVACVGWHLAQRSDGWQGARPCRFLNFERISKNGLNSRKQK
jgi:hypothetical protein